MKNDSLPVGYLSSQKMDISYPFTELFQKLIYSILVKYDKP